MMDPFFETFFKMAGLALFAFMLPILYRLIAGPTAIDRIVAANVIGTKTAVLLVIIGVLFGKVGMFVDFALAYALLNFIGSLAAARYFHQVRIRNGSQTEEMRNT
ncbi:MAG: multicomponent Na+:H+ antiporter subunit F [Verrucomicrobiales bacterium]|jgi:multicomponent Na+:H+ antiporter subunit F